MNRTDLLILLSCLAIGSVLCAAMWNAWDQPVGTPTFVVK